MVKRTYYSHPTQQSQRNPVQYLLRLLDPDRWLELAFLAALLLVVLVFHNRTVTSITAKDFIAAWFGLFLVPLSLYVLSWTGCSKRIWLSLWVPLGGYLLYGTLRSWWSPFPIHAWDQWRLTLTSMTPVLPAFVLLHSRKSSGRLLLGVFLSAWLVCIYALLQFVAYTLDSFWGWGQGFDPVHWPWNQMPLVSVLLGWLETDLRTFEWQRFPGWGKFPAVCSTIGNPTYLAGLLVTLAPLFLALTLAKGVWKRCAIPFFLTLWVIVAGLGVTFSKGAVLGLLGGGAMFLASIGAAPPDFLRVQWRRAARLAATVLLLLTFLLLGGVFFLANRGTPDLREDLGSVRNRAIVYRATWELIREHFWFGVSPGNYVIEFPDYLEGALAQEYGRMESPEEKVLEHAHCELLEIWADLGLVGLTLFLGFSAGWLLLVRQGWWTAPPGIERWALLGLASGVAGSAFESLASVSLRWMPGAWVFWAFVGASAGLAARMIRIPTAAAPRLRQPAQYWVVPASAAIALILFLPSTSRFCADWHFVNGRAAALKKHPVAEPELTRAIDLNPAHAQARYILGGWYFNAGKLRNAIDQFERVRDLRGYVVVLAENLATAYFKLSLELEKDYERQDAVLQAIDLYEESLGKHSGYPRLEDYLARAYQRLGFGRLAQEHRQRAIDLYEQWFAWKGSYPRPDFAIDLAKNYLLEDQFEKAFWQLRNARRWEGDAERIGPVLTSLIEKEPSLKALWDREEEKLINQKAGKKEP